MEVLYRAKAQSFLSTSICPDASVPFRLMRAIPSSITIPKFTPIGEVMNPAAVMACLTEIVDLEQAEALEAQEAAEDALQVRDTMFPTVLALACPNGCLTALSCLLCMM